MGSVFTALVIDDDPTVRNILEKFLETDGRVNVYEGLESVVNALEIIEKLDPDVIFLDINMPYEDGLQFGARLRQTDNNSLLVFCTAFRNYAIDAFELKPFDFLVKPFGIVEITRLIDKLADEFNKRNNFSKKIWSKENFGKYKFKTATGYVFMKPQEVMFVRCIGNNSELITSQGKTIKLLPNVSEIQEFIDNTQFFKVNRSSIINIDYITSVDRKNKSCRIKSGSFEYEFFLTTKSLNELENLLLIKLN